MTQLGGMIRYEILMHWRRRGVLMMMILFLVMIAGITVLISNNGVMKNQIQEALQPLDDAVRVNHIDYQFAAVGADGVQHHCSLDDSGNCAFRPPISGDGFIEQPTAYAHDISTR
jgi:hypothetical protein